MATRTPMTTEELLALPVTVDIPTAGRAFGMGRDKAYRLAQANQFPCPVLPLGSQFKVTRAALLKALGIEAPTAAEMPASQDSESSAA